MSGDSDILLLLWVLRSGVPATASCASTEAPVQIQGTSLLQQNFSQIAEIGYSSGCPMSSAQKLLIRALYLGPQSSTAMPQHPACITVGLQAKVMLSNDSNMIRSMGVGAGYRLRCKAAANAQHELDWVWARRSAHGAGHIMGLWLHSCTVLFLSILC